MSKGMVAILVSVWFTVAGAGIGLASLINTTMARLDDRITRLDDRITRLDGRITKLAEGQAELRERITQLDDQIARLHDRIIMLAEGQSELRERITRVETILGEVRTLAAVEGAGAGLGPAVPDDEAPRSFP